jgi:hypothetical protein
MTNMNVEPQEISGLPENDYAALPHLSASKLRVAIKHNHDQALKVFEKSSFDDQHSLGKWLHYYILEAPESAPDIVKGCPEHLFYSINKGREALSKHRDVQDMIGDSKREHTYLWYETLIPGNAKARLDILHSEGIWDLKCIRGGSEIGSFEKKMKRLSWHVQAWWYQRAVEKVLGQRLDVGFIIIDTHNWVLKKYCLGKPELEKASNQARESMRKLKRWGLV